MKSKVLTAAGGALATAAIATAGAAHAGPPKAADFGTALRVVDGPVVTSYAVSDPRPSDDVVNVPLDGQLYESTATVRAVDGTVTPAIPFFNARTDEGQNYRVLYQAFAPEGISAATMREGESHTGKIYFDVTGPAPDEVVYNDAVQDRLIWD